MDLPQSQQRGSQAEATDPTRGAASHTNLERRLSFKDEINEMAGNLSSTSVNRFLRPDEVAELCIKVLLAPAVIAVRTSKRHHRDSLQELKTALKKADDALHMANKAGLPHLAGTCAYYIGLLEFYAVPAPGMGALLYRPKARESIEEWFNMAVKLIGDENDQGKLAVKWLEMLNELGELRADHESFPSSPDSPNERNTGWKEENSLQAAEKGKVVESTEVDHAEAEALNVQSGEQSQTIEDVEGPANADIDRERTSQSEALEDFNKAKTPGPPTTSHRDGDGKEVGMKKAKTTEIEPEQDILEEVEPEEVKSEEDGKGKEPARVEGTGNDITEKQDVLPVQDDKQGEEGGGDGEEKDPNVRSAGQSRRKRRRKKKNNSNNPAQTNQPAGNQDAHPPSVPQG